MFRLVIVKILFFLYIFQYLGFLYIFLMSEESSIMLENVGYQNIDKKVV